MKIQVREGLANDGKEALDVLHRSILELCVQDHGGDEADIADWLSNKTERTWSVWLGREDAAVFVVEKVGKVVGVGMIDHRGEILLNYVAPDVRFSGVSKAVLAALENSARKWGLKACFLESTETAKAFYESRGYRPLDGSRLNLCKRL